MTETEMEMGAMVYGAIAINTVATVYLYEAIDTIEDNPKIYRHEVKRACSKIREAVKVSNTVTARRLHRREDANFIKDFGCLLYGRVEADIMILQSCMANALAKAGNRDSMFKARWLTALYLCELSCKFIDDRLAEPSARVKPWKNGMLVDMKRVLEPMRLTAITRNVLFLERAMCVTADAKDTDLNMDKDIKAAMNVLNRRLGNVEMLEEVFAAAQDAAAKK